MRSTSDLVAKGPRHRRAILAVGVLLCIGLALAGAYFLGWLEQATR